VTQPVDQGIAQDNMAHDHHDQTDGVLADVALLFGVVHGRKWCAARAGWTAMIAVMQSIANPG
jgi:hypothetical protein